CEDLLHQRTSHTGNDNALRLPGGKGTKPVRQPGLYVFFQSPCPDMLFGTQQRSLIHIHSNGSWNPLFHKQINGNITMIASHICKDHSRTCQSCNCLQPSGNLQLLSFFHSLSPDNLSACGCGWDGGVSLRLLP